MQVFKFGGASVGSTERIYNVAGILKRYKDEKLLVVISAMGKTTNALEKVVEAFYRGAATEALALFEKIKEEHIAIAANLGITDHGLADFFTEVEWLLHDKPVRQYDYYYDQVVCAGELFSTVIMSRFLALEGIPNQWIDVRDIVRTDNNFRDARIDWNVTAAKVQERLWPIFNENNIIITQGFIAATDDNESTTLGREGSDYTAAVFANLLDAQNQTIWKDVPGVMNADPKQYKDAALIKELSYKEVIEMAFYGAQVIHPKTIKPLQNKSIPLYVKSFIHPEAEGTVINNIKVTNLPPIIVYKQNQVLLQFNSRDFSFVSEGLSATIYELLQKQHLKPNLTQNAAISLLCVVDGHAQNIEQFALEASGTCDVVVTKGLTLLTIRHYNTALLEQLCKDCNIILQQQTPETVQVLLQAQDPGA